MLERDGRVRAIVGDWKSEWHDAHFKRDPSKSPTWAIDPPIKIDMPGVTEGDILIEFEGEPVAEIIKTISYKGSTCIVCHGQGCEEGCGRCEHVNAGPDSHKVCKRCGGAGVIGATKGERLGVGEWMVEPHGSIDLNHAELDPFKLRGVTIRDTDGKELTVLQGEHYVRSETMPKGPRTRGR